MHQATIERTITLALIALSVIAVQPAVQAQPPGCDEVKTAIAPSDPSKPNADSEARVAVWEERFSGREVDWKLEFRGMEREGPAEVAVFACPVSQAGPSLRVLFYESDFPPNRFKGYQVNKQYNLDFTLDDFKPETGEILGVIEEVEMF